MGHTITVGSIESPLCPVLAMKKYLSQLATITDNRPSFHGHGFIGYPKGRNVERALGPSCPCVLCVAPVPTSPNLANEPEGRVMIVALHAPSLAKFGEVDTVPVSEKCDNPRMTRY